MIENQWITRHADVSPQEVGVVDSVTSCPGLLGDDIDP